MFSIHCNIITLKELPRNQTRVALEFNQWNHVVDLCII